MPPPSPRSGLSPLSVGLQWASTITTIGLEMALPLLVGVWLDRRFGTMPWGTLSLAVLGFSVAMLHIWQLARRLSAASRPQRASRTPQK